MTIPVLRFDDLETFAAECEKTLLVPNPTKFLYPTDIAKGLEQGKPWDSYADEIKRINARFLGSLRGKANIYALYTHDTATASWKLRYLGVSKRNDIRQRLTAHLIKKDERTGSQLENVKAAVKTGVAVAVSVVLVEPESLRLAVEEIILATRKQDLPWNTHG